ncbi:tetratricopeptide repeat protein [Phenylobacterium sp.]|uniref:tetratricopeptide repeat protein n=1 Tax=Phenylobacterium sp. TaxID=1871053 RepID=UPI0025D552C3|nr:tetratricopeptide repeat protein [Phenylobacterium sp.]
MSRIRLFLAAATITGLAATGAHGQAVTVLGGGMARLCSYAALAGDFDVSAEGNCTSALTTEVLSPLDRAGTFVNRGVMKLRRKDFAGARADFDSALQAKPDMGEAFLNRGAAALGARRFADSLSDLSRAIELGVQEPEKAFYNRALAYEKLGQRQAAFLDYTKAIELKPEWEQPRTELARLTQHTP